MQCNQYHLFSYAPMYVDSPISLIIIIINFTDLFVFYCNIFTQTNVRHNTNFVYFCTKYYTCTSHDSDTTVTNTGLATMTLLEFLR